VSSDFCHCRIRSRKSRLRVSRSGWQSLSSVRSTGARAATGAWVGVGGGGRYSKQDGRFGQVCPVIRLSIFHFGLGFHYGQFWANY
jgi:hypothetical protein